MNLVDVLLLAVFAVAVYRGYREGFIEGSLKLLGWLGSLVIAIAVYPRTESLVNRYLPVHNLLVLGLAFLVTILLGVVVINLVVRFITARIPADAPKSLTDHLFGVLPGALNGLIYISVLSAVLLIVPLSETVTRATSASVAARQLQELLRFAEETVAPGFSQGIQRALGKMKVETGSTDFTKLTFKVRYAQPLPELEKQMLYLLNRERRNVGLDTLQADTALRTVARKHSDDMFSRGYFSHYSPEKVSPFDRIRAAGIFYRTAGENLAIAPTLALAHDGLMKSPGHRANILQPDFGRVGIGILDGGIYGIMVTQNFRD